MPEYNGATVRDYTVDRPLGGISRPTLNQIIDSEAIRVDETAGRAMYAWDTLNNREQLIYGDTGWRDISADLPAGLVKSISGNANTPRIRRVGNIVELELYLDCSAASITTLYTIPVGFKQYVYSRIGQLFTATTAGHSLPPTVTTTYLTTAVRSTALPNPGTAQYSAMWITTDPWPTTLPGTAIETISNL